MTNQYPSYLVWIGKGIHKFIKLALGSIYNDIKEFIINFCGFIRGLIIGLYIINTALLGYYDKRIEEHGFTRKGMKLTGIFFWMTVCGITVIYLNTLYGIIIYGVGWFFVLSYFIYLNNKEEFYKEQPELAKEIAKKVLDNRIEVVKEEITRKIDK